MNATVPDEAPDPPVNVVVHLADGTSVPVQMVFAEVDWRGMRIWQAVSPGFDWPGWAQVTRVTCDQVPGKTALAFPVTSR